MEWLIYWYWLALALLLIIAETLGAAGFLLALGTAAVTTGLLTWIFTIHWQWQLILFSLLCIFFAFAWWHYLYYRVRTSKPVSLINRPLEAMIGRTTTLVEGIEEGRGKIRINDAHWFVTGPNLLQGSKVRVIAVVDHSLLLVEAADKSE